MTHLSHTHALGRLSSLTLAFTELYKLGIPFLYQHLVVSKTHAKSIFGLERGSYPIGTADGIQCEIDKAKEDWTFWRKAKSGLRRLDALRHVRTMVLLSLPDDKSLKQLVFFHNESDKCGDEVLAPLSHLDSLSIRPYALDQGLRSGSNDSKVPTVILTLLRRSRLSGLCLHVSRMRTTAPSPTLAVVHEDTIVNALNLFKSHCTGLEIYAEVGRPHLRSVGLFKGECHYHLVGWGASDAIKVEYHWYNAKGRATMRLDWCPVCEIEAMTPPGRRMAFKQKKAGSVNVYNLGAGFGQSLTCKEHALSLDQALKEACEAISEEVPALKLHWQEEDESCCPVCTGKCAL